VADNTRIDELRRRLDKEPGSRLFAQLAEELRKEGELSDAIRVARTGLLQHPAYPSAHMTLGRALLDTGDLAGARAQFEAVLRGAPDNILASRFLGETLETMGDLGSALLQYRATLRLAPGDRQIETQISKLEERLGAPTLRKATPPPPPPPARPPVPPAPTAIAEVPAPPAAREPSPVEVPPLPPAAPPTETPAVAGSASALPPTSPVPFAPASEVSFELEAPFESAGEARAPVPPPPQPPPPLPPAAPPPETLKPAEPAPAPPLPLDLPFAPTSEPSFDLEAPFETTVAAPPVPEPSPGRRLTDQAVVEARNAPPLLAPPLPLEPLPPAREPVLTPEPEPTPAPAPPAEPPALSSSTLAELYFNQGFTDQAVEVYKELLQREPDNERVRARLAEITSVDRGPQAGTPPASGGPTADPRAERRRVLEQTIARFEDMLAAIKRG
jgi:tetratricopeptide (TPR) repeat protein